MKKAEAISGITKLWIELPETDRTALNFHNFYQTVETDHPDLLTWRNLSGRRENEVKAQLIKQKLMKLT